MPSWVKTASGTVSDLNQNLCKLRNIDIEIAEKEHTGFADIFWPMITSAEHAHEIYGPEYAVSGKDGVHPGWAGHTLMAYAFLKALGVDGEIGTLTVDLAANQATASQGHAVLGFQNGEAQFKSSRYPFCASGGEMGKDDNIRSGMTLVPFQKDLNRLMLIVKGGKAANYEVIWGETSHTYTWKQLASGINLADEFPVNPFTEAFKKVDAAVGAKQDYEQKEIQQIFHALLGGKFKTADEIKDPEIKELFGLRTADGALDSEGGHQGRGSEAGAAGGGDQGGVCAGDAILLRLSRNSGRRGEMTKPECRMTMGAASLAFGGGFWPQRGAARRNCNQTLAWNEGRRCETGRRIVETHGRESGKCGGFNRVHSRFSNSD